MNALQKFKKKHDLDDGEIAAGAGAAATLGPAAAFSLKHELADLADNSRVPGDLDFDAFKKKLQPGDVLYHHIPSNTGTKVPPVLGQQLPITQRELMMAAKGDPHYHSSIYLGEDSGKQYISEAAGIDHGVLSHANLGKESGNMRAYRPKATAQIPEALQYTLKAHGTPYMAEGDQVKAVMKHLFSPFKEKTSGKVPCKGSYCTQHVAEAYNKIYDDPHMSTSDLRNSKNMELIGRFEAGAKVSAKEKVLSRLLYPALKNLKYGVGAAAAAYGGMKLNDYLNED